MNVQLVFYKDIEENDKVDVTGNPKVEVVQELVILLVHEQTVR